MSLFAINRSLEVRVRVWRQHGTPADLGGWCISIGPKPANFCGPNGAFIARHTTERSARAHAARIRKAIGGVR